MAALVLRFKIDTGPAEQAGEELVEAYDRLAKRHGQAFRDLEREIEAIAEEYGDKPAHPCQVHHLGEDYFIVAAPEPITELLRRCRQLGVL